jgi:hypothetical protein
MPTVLVKLRGQSAIQPGRPPARLNTLAGKTVALLDISKPGGSVFLDRLAQLLVERYSVARVVRAAKPTFTRPAPRDVIQGLLDAGAQAVVEALAD